MTVYDVFAGHLHTYNGHFCFQCIYLSATNRLLCYVLHQATDGTYWLAVIHAYITLQTHQSLLNGFKLSVEFTRKLGYKGTT